MRSTLSIEIAAPPELVFQLARDIERWPRLLPHYLSVGVISRLPDGSTTVRMIALRPLFGLSGFGLPVAWRARTWAEPDSRRLRFRHLGGATAGMDVTWRIEPTESGCHVAIDHEFRRRLPIPGLGDLLGDQAFPAFVDRFFTRPIARTTLATFAALAEAIAEGERSDPTPHAYPIP
jgi:ribosome-associated toxin RatA of RatAB toxin-antitoxin module